MVETADMQGKPLSDWVPEDDAMVLAVVGKLGEELSEASKIIFRIVIQGLDGRDPETGKLNTVALEEELADVMAMTRNAVDRLGLHDNLMQQRAAKKLAWKKPWFDFTRRLASQRGS